MEGRRARLRLPILSHRAVTISKIELQDGVVELFDATVSRPPLKTRLEQVDAVS
jgi:hypothetical protein